MLETFLKKTTREGAIYFIAQIAAAIIGVVSISIFTRIFLPSEYGFIVLVMLFVTFGDIIFGNWLASAVGRFYPHYQQKGQLNAFNSTLFFNVVLSVTIFYVLTCCIYFFVRDSIIIQLKAIIPAIILMIPFTIIFNVSLALLRIKQQATSYAKFFVGKRFLSLAVGVLLVTMFRCGVVGIFWGEIIALMFVNIIMVNKLVFINKYVKLHQISFSVTSDFFKFGMPIMVASIGSWILSSSDRYIIKYFRETFEVGLYSIAYNIGDFTIKMLVNSFILAMIPLLVTVWESGDKELTEMLLQRLMRILILVVLPAVIGLSVLAESLFKIFATQVYYQGFIVVPFIAVSALGYGLSLFVSTGLALAKRTILTARNYWIAAIGNIILNIIFVPRFGFIAAAATTTVSYIGLFFLNVKSAHKYFKWRIMPRSAINSVIASSCMGIVIFGVITKTANVFLATLLSIFIGIIIYFVILLLLGEFTHEEKTGIKKFLKNFLRV